MPEGEDKIYPGSIDRYRSLRELRETLGPVTADTSPEHVQSFLASVIAEELAGLSYILDGIRYSARRS